MVGTQRLRAVLYIDLKRNFTGSVNPRLQTLYASIYRACSLRPTNAELPEGLPVVSRYIHMCDVTIMSAGHKVKSYPTLLRE